MLCTAKSLKDLYSTWACGQAYSASTQVSSEVGERMQETGECKSLCCKRDQLASTAGSIRDPKGDTSQANHAHCQWPHSASVRIRGEAMLCEQV